MKLKKYILIGLMAVLVVAACGKKENNKNNGKAKTLNMKKEISTEEIKKYNEYLKISNEPNSEEWNSFFKEIKKEEFLDTNGEIKNVSNKAMSIETLDHSINLIGEYIREISDIMQESPKIEAIDKNAENLINSLVEEQKVLTEIDDYFEKGDYKKDRLERVQELNDKYKVVLQNRQENNKIFSNSLRELAQAINKKMEEKLKKDKNIILIDATNPFGMDDYLPKGRLRESLDALKRADEIIITKSNYVSVEEIAKIKERLAKYQKPISVATFEESYFYKLNFENGKKFGKINNGNKMENEKLPLRTIQNKNVLIFSSIANPAVFYQTIKKLNPSNIDEIKFTDHHVYTNEEILEIKKKAQNYDYVLTTEKDIVKIDENIENLLILKMEFKIVEK